MSRNRSFRQEFDQSRSPTKTGEAENRIFPTPDRLHILLFCVVGMITLWISEGLVNGAASQPGRFQRLDYSPLPATSLGANAGGRFLMGFSGRVEGRMRREVGVPIFTLDILGADIDVNPLVTSFPAGPARLVRLNRISENPPVVRATFFLRSLMAPRLRSTHEGLEVSFEDDRGGQTPTLMAPVISPTGTNALLMTSRATPYQKSSGFSAGETSTGNYPEELAAQDRKPVSFPLLSPNVTHPENVGHSGLFPGINPIVGIQPSAPEVWPPEYANLPGVVFQPPYSPASASTGSPIGGISLNVKGTDAQVLMRELAKQAGLNLHFRDPISGLIDVVATLTTPLEALNSIADKLGAGVTVEEGEAWIALRANPLAVFSEEDGVEGADLRGLALGDVLRALGRLGNLNIVLDPSLEELRNKPVDLLLTHMSCRQAFETLMRLYDLSLRAIDARTLLVLSRREASKAAGSAIRVVNLKAAPKKVLDLLKNAAPPRELERVAIREDQGNLILTGDREAVEILLPIINTIEEKLARAGEGNARELFRPVNTKPSELMKLIDSALGEGNKPRIANDIRTDTLIVTGPREIVNRAVELMRSLDKQRTGQALIHIRLMEMHLQDLTNLGINFTQEQISVANIFNLPRQAPLPAALHLLESTNRAKTLANPTLRCMDKQEAQIDISEQIPVKTPVTDYLPVASTSLAARTTENWTTTDIGIKLKVTPQIHSDNEVTLDVNVNFIELVQFVEGHPWTAKRNVTTSIRVKDRESVIIGGLIRRKTSETRKHFPWIRRLPLIGGILRGLEQKDKTEETTEMVMIITPTIVGSGGASSLSEVSGIQPSCPMPAKVTITPNSPVSPVSTTSPVSWERAKDPSKNRRTLEQSPSLPGKPSLKVSR
ncbi:MAG: secretin N-terminal domain-containing protein [Candidatus Ozemobacteraceae bacterium]